MALRTNQKPSPKYIVGTPHSYPHKSTTSPLRHHRKVSMWRVQAAYW